MARILLVHPPLLGPTVWQECAIELRGRGHRVIVPDLRAQLEPAADWWARWTDACRQAAANIDLLAGHSGSGVVLPTIAQATHARTVVFADAVVPALDRASPPNEQLRAFVRALPSDDHLPAWTTWWPEDDVAAILPDPAVRATIAAEQPRLPADFYDHAVPVPEGWTTGRTITYLRFSPAYESDADEAGRRGWSVRNLPGTHLHLLDHAVEVADVLSDLADPDTPRRPSPPS
jgi:hypothetical protein